MKCSKCEAEIIPGDECVTGEGKELCVKCYSATFNLPVEAENVKPTRKPRSDRGRPRGPKAGPWVLQSQASDKRYWCDLAGYPTEAKAWASVKEAGRYRVIRVHGQERTATEKTTITLE